MGKGFGRGSRVTIVTHAQQKSGGKKTPRGLRGSRQIKRKKFQEKRDQQQQLEESMGIRPDKERNTEKPLSQQVASIQFPHVVNKRQKGFKQLRKQIIDGVRDLRRRIMSQKGDNSTEEIDEKKQRKEMLRKGLQAMFAAQSSRPQTNSDEDSADEGNVPVSHEQSERHGVSEEVLNIDTKSKLIEISNIRLFSLEEIELDKLTECISLSLRKNLIHELIPFPDHLAARLEELDFFDNKIRKLRDFFSTVKSFGDLSIKQNVKGAFGHLTKLDLSYNQIKEIGGLEPIAPTLKELYLVENKIKEIKNLESLVNLELLELGGNRIREIGDGLMTLKNLKQLWLGKNKIVAIGNSLQNLVSLEILSLQANRIISIEKENFLGTDANPNLREVYLSENGLKSIENVGKLSAVKIIDFSFNEISSINAEEINPQTMPLLEEFWITDAKIENWDEVKKLSGFKNSLKTVYLERNPIEQDKRYRNKVFMYLPFLSNIDSWEIVNKEDPEADRQRRA